MNQDSKRFLRAGALAFALLAASCGQTSSPTSQSSVHEHEYVTHASVDATCHSKGNELYYTCSGCDKIFDASKAEIAAIPETEIDPTNHDGEISIVASGTFQTAYVVGETFNMAGVVITLKCANCEGYALTASELAKVKIAYPTANADCFTAEDASSAEAQVTLSYLSYSTKVSVTINKASNAIEGLSALEGHCGYKPFTSLEGVTSTSGTIEYAFADPSEADPSTLTYHTAAELGESYSFNVVGEGESTVYHVRASVAEDASYNAVVAYTTLTITHNSSWDKSDPAQDVYGCICSDPIVFRKVVTATNDIDLSSSENASISLEGVSSYASISSIKATIGEAEYDLGTDLANLDVAALKEDKSLHGESTVTVVVLDATGEDHTIQTPVTFATKLIGSAEDYVSYVVPSSTNTVVTGYYKQTADINLLDSVSSVGFNWSYYFAGTYDGGGHSITAKTYSYGIFSQLGSNNATSVYVTVKNLTILDKWTANWGSILCKAMYNTTLDGVTIKAVAGADYTDCKQNTGYLAFGLCQNVAINNCDIDVTGHTVATILSYNTNVNGITFSNSTLEVKAFTSLYHSLYLENSGADITVYAPTEAEGLTITLA